uniref:Uncharacterized protein n=1 Tax=Triticum urartu TaxID=4572 RepID=A0A8R7U7B9_TRIUA
IDLLAPSRSDSGTALYTAPQLNGFPFASRGAPSRAVWPRRRRRQCPARAALPPRPRCLNATWARVATYCGDIVLCFLVGGT